MTLSVDEFVRTFPTCPLCQTHLEFNGTIDIHCPSCHSFYGFISPTNIKQMDYLDLHIDEYTQISFLLPDQVLHIKFNDYEDIILLPLNQAIKLFKTPSNLPKFLLLQ